MRVGYPRTCFDAKGKEMVISDFVVVVAKAVMDSFSLHDITYTTVGIGG